MPIFSLNNFIEQFNRIENQVFESLINRLSYVYLFFKKVFSLFTKLIIK